MVAEVGDFRFTTVPSPHPARAKAILREHPEVRTLFGPNPWSMAVILGTVGLQFSLAFLLREQPWWLMFVAAWCIGAFANHAMYVMIHEAGHNLIFRGHVWNKLAGITADLVNVVPASASFGVFHQRHHAHLNQYDTDPDLPHRWEARLIGSGPIGKTAWFMLFPLFELARPFRLKDKNLVTPWVVFNWVMVLGVNLAVFYFWGPKAFSYLLASTWFGLGLHPLGARWVQEHYLVLSNEQETISYYGPLNVLMCNVGYHNEHHDFAVIPWNRLPRLKQMAPEYYESLLAHRSMTYLLLRFIFDRNISLYSRMHRAA